MEIFKQITGYEGLYEVSNYGRVKTYARGKPGLIRRISQYGKYFGVSLRKNKTNKSFYIHRLVAEHFIENTGNKKEVNHIDGIKSHNNAINLEWVTSSENKQHAISIGLWPFGDKSGARKLSKANPISRDVILEIKRLHEDIRTPAWISRETGISRYFVRSIVNNKKWEGVQTIKTSK